MFMANSVPGSDANFPDGLVCTHSWLNYAMRPSKVRQAMASTSVACDDRKIVVTISFGFTLMSISCVRSC